MKLRPGTIGMIVGTILLCPILYCAYFDYRRRHSPSFRRLIRDLVRQYRRNEKQQRLQYYRDLIDKRLEETPIPTSEWEVTQFIVLNLTEGENQCAKGKYEDAALNYYFALDAYSSPHELMPSVCSDKNVRAILRTLVKVRPFNPSEPRYRTSLLVA
ncbi:hypothetical protein V1506DRAFT_530729 [Lipomyces tetrasporus]